MGHFIDSWLLIGMICLEKLPLMMAFVSIILYFNYKMLGNFFWIYRDLAFNSIIYIVILTRYCLRKFLELNTISLFNFAINYNWFGFKTHFNLTHYYIYQSLLKLSSFHYIWCLRMRGLIFYIQVNLGEAYFHLFLYSYESFIFIRFYSGFLLCWIHLQTTDWIIVRLLVDIYYSVELTIDWIFQGHHLEDLVFYRCLFILMIGYLFKIHC